MSKEAIKTKFIICDLDGCLIKSGWIWDVVKEKGFSKDVAFDFFNRSACCDACEIDVSLYKYLCFKASGGFRLHFLTARSEVISVETINFIQQKTGLIYGKEFTISFRPANDLSSPADSKARRLDAMIADKKEILLAIDDEDEILKMYQKRGIKTIKWISGFLPLEIVREFGEQLNGLFGMEVKCLN